MSEVDTFRCPICDQERSRASEHVAYYFRDPFGDFANDELIAHYCVHCVAALPSKVATLEQQVADLTARLDREEDYRAEQNERGQ